MTRSTQISIPKGVRDRMTIPDEEIILGLIGFAYEQGRNRGYDEGYSDAFEDYATTKTVDAQ